MNSTRTKADAGKGSVQRAIRLAKAGNLEEALAEYVHAKERVTFPELQRFMAAFIEVQGEVCPGLEYDNVLLWIGMSDRLVDLIFQARSHHKICFHPSSAEEHWSLGEGILNLPIVKADRPYKSDRWLPTVMCSYAHPCSKDAPTYGGAKCHP